MTDAQLKTKVKKWLRKDPELANKHLQLAHIILQHESTVGLSLSRLLPKVEAILLQLAQSPESNIQRTIKMDPDSIITKIEKDFHGNISQAAKDMDIPYSTLQDMYNTSKDGSRRKIKRFIVTYAQNNTAIHQGFFAALQQYMKLWNAELICYRGRYKNPTRPSEELYQTSREWWSDDIRPYLMQNERKLNSNVMIFPAMTQPTAEKPLLGYETTTGAMSGIFPHPKLHLTTVATPGHMTPKILTTTGAITLENYSASKAGQKAKHHHIIGACIVEIENDKMFHIRQIQAENDGSFYDIAGGTCKYYTPKTVEDSTIDIHVRGDFHYPWIDPVVIKAGNKLQQNLKPYRQYIHDVIDFWRRNHHEANNRFLNAAKYENGQMSVYEEMAQTAEFIKNDIARPKEIETVIVRANHDEAFDKWLAIADIEELGINAKYFHWLSYNKHASAKKSINGFKFHNTLEFALNEFIDCQALNIRFLDRDVPEVVNQIDYSMHGDDGANGARGSVDSLSKIGVKSTIAHHHSPGIVGGCYQVGVNCVIPLGYASGPSGWLATDSITYKNGKRALINYINGKYCL